MSFFVFIDNSNVWIEGKYASAVNSGMANTIMEAHANGVQDNAWRIDFGKMLNLITNGCANEVKKAVLFGSKPPANDSLWNAIKSSNIKVVALDRNVANKEKAIDTGIVKTICKSAYKEAEEGDVFLLVLGDKDFLPAVEAIHEEKCKAVIVFWNNVSRELSSAGDEFIDLSLKIEEITFCS